MTYKEVFQLAQDKGYKCRMNWQIVKQGMTHQIFPVDELVIFELTLIQKWLRDEKEIDIEVSNQYTSPVLGKWYFAKVLYMDRRVLMNKRTYEDALLDGITEALNLIK